MSVNTTPCSCAHEAQIRPTGLDCPCPVGRNALYTALMVGSTALTATALQAAYLAQLQQQSEELRRQQVGCENQARLQWHTQTV